LLVAYFAVDLSSAAITSSPKAIMRWGCTSSSTHSRGTRRPSIRRRLAPRRVGHVRLLSVGTEIAISVPPGDGVFAAGLRRYAGPAICSSKRL